MESELRYWFPAKRYGWGWGPPATWQGWLVLAAFVGLLVAAAVRFPPNRQTGAFIVCVVTLSVVLTLVCWIKGEPPRWRWGDDRG
jgi:CHASE2 domain-containing sensor protein